MSFAGHIEDFPVIDILQYVHASRQSGTLNFNRENQAGLIFENIPLRKQVEEKYH